MQFQPMYDDGQLFLPKIELDMTSNQTIGIITDLKRKQFLMNQLADRSQYYIFRAGQNEYVRLTVEELIAFLIHVTERSERVDSLLDYFALKEERKVKIKDMPSSKRMYVTLLRVFFAHQPTLVLEEPYFYLEEQDQANITLQKISTKRKDKVILFNPPEIDYIESINGSVLVHADGENYDCALTLTELEQKLLNFGFFRCHRSYIVNLQKVREIITWTKNSYSLRLNTGKDAVVPLSRSKLQELKALLHI